MTKLINDDNVIITDPDKVADMQQNFYEKLYYKDRNLPEREHIRDKLDHLNIPSLPDHISESLEAKLYMKELTVTLKIPRTIKPQVFFQIFLERFGHGPY